MRPATGLLFMILLAPAATAAVTVDHVEAPPRTAAGTAFDVTVRLVNDGPARDIHLFGALYARVEDEGPCGPATDPRFRAFTHLVQERVRLPANSVTDYPSPGERWQHRYDRDDVRGAREDAVLCILVANATTGPTIQYETYGTTELETRAQNALPQVGFTWTPSRPAVSRDVQFTATATDPDGDPLTYRWDFGHHTASGRANATGQETTHTFYPTGDYLVTLFVSDGIDEVNAGHVVSVRQAGDENDRRTPLAPTIAIVSVLIAVALGRRR